ncbi:MAG: iron-sulfur cluster assembly scaffold protein [Gammaproteobacteria bacterium]
MKVMASDIAEYSAVVLTHFRAPHNAGVFSSGTARVFKGHAGGRRHGREVEFQLQITVDGRVADCRYRVYGCPATIALCSLTSDALKGLPLADATALSVVALAEQCGLPAEKRAAAIMVEDAVRAVVAGYNAQEKSLISNGHEAKLA